jgi:hypothetical protein
LENLAKGKALAEYPTYHAWVETLSRCHAEACWAAEDQPVEGEAHVEVN